MLFRSPNEIVSLYAHAVMMIVLCLSFPILSKKVVEPMLSDLMFFDTKSVLGAGNFYVMIVMLISVFVFPAVMMIVSKKIKKTYVISYMGGANAGDNKNFINSYGGETQLYMSNWYMESLFGEKKILNISLGIAAVVLIVLLCVIIGGAI